MNDDNTNRPRDNTVTPGGDFSNMEYVAEAIIFELNAKDMITIDEARRLVNLAGRIFYSQGFNAGQTHALLELARLQITTRQPVNEHKDLNISTTQAQSRFGDALPLQLLTHEARTVWQALVEAQFLDQDWKPLQQTTNGQCMYIALAMGMRFLGDSVWQPFERLWNKSHLAQQHYRMTDTGHKPDRWKEIDKIVGWASNKS